MFFYLYMWNAFRFLVGKKGKLFVLNNKGREGHCMPGNAPVFSIPSHRGNRPYTCRDEFQYNPPPHPRPPFLTLDMYGWLRGETVNSVESTSRCTAGIQIQPLARHPSLTCRSRDPSTFFVTSPHPPGRVWYNRHFTFLSILSPLHPRKQSVKVSICV